MQRFLLYMLREATHEPIAYLAQPTSATDRQWLMNGERNLGCGALLGLAVGRPLGHAGRAAMVGFSPVAVSVSDQAVVRYGPGAGARRSMPVAIKDPARFAEAATRATAELLQSFPLRNAPPAGGTNPVLARPESRGGRARGEFTGDLRREPPTVSLRPGRALAPLGRRGAHFRLFSPGVQSIV